MKRLISWLLVLCLVVSMAPVSVFAATEENQPEAQVSNDQVTFEGNNALGGLLAEELQAKQEEDVQTEEESGGYIVLDLLIEGSTAFVSYETIEDAQLVVAIYTEDSSQLLCTGKLAVESGSTDAVVEIKGTMPQYFMAQAFLLDNYDFSPLCKAYTTPMYTKAMQDLLASTAEDYDQDRVLTTGEDSTNFLVYHDHVLVIRPQADVNILAESNEETRTYKITNADNSVTGLQAGDVFVYENSATDLVFVKVDSIAVTGNTVVVQGQDLELTDVFSHIKLEEGVANGPATYARNSSTYGAQRDISGDWSDTYQKEYEIDEDLVSGQLGKLHLNVTLALKLEPVVSYYVSFSQCFLKFTLDITADISASTTGEISYEKELGDFKIDLEFISIGLKPVFTLEASGELSYEITITHHLGFAYEIGAGYQNLCSEAPVISTGEWKAEAQISIMLDLCPNIQVCGGSVLSVNFHMPIGFDLYAMLYDNPNHEDESQYGDMQHLCEMCLETSIFFKALPELEIVVFEQDWLTKHILLPSTYKNILDMYYSISSNEFGFSRCPYKLYKLTIAPENSKDLPVTNTQTIICDAAGTVVDSGTTNGNGVFSTYLYPGTYKLSVLVEDVWYEYTRDFTEAGKQLLGPNVDPEHSFFASKADPNLYRDHGSVTKTGTDANGNTWELWESGLLRIYRKDDSLVPMEDYSYVFDAPWGNFGSRVTQIEIGKGITHVGKNAFYRYNTNGFKIKKITIGEDVRSIGDYAFYSSFHLETVEFGRNLRTIGASAFYGCTSLKEIYLHNNVTSIGISAFNGCTALSTIRLSNRLTTIDSNAFYNCESITGIDFPASLTTIGDYAFYECDSLKELVIPENITTIGSCAFTRCDNLERIEYNAINASVTTSHAPFGGSGHGGKGIDVVIGAKVTQIPATLFFRGYSVYTDPAPNVVTLTFATGSQCTEIGSSAFCECNNLTQIVFPEGLQKIGSNAFYDCTSLNQVVFPETLLSIGENAFGHGDGKPSNKIKELCIPDSVTSIGRYAFSRCDALETVSIGSGLATISDSTFYQCTTLKTLTLSEGLVTIGSSAFRGCTALEEVVFPSSVKTIDSYAFRDCTALSQVVIPDAVTALNSYSFAGNTALRSVVLGSGVKSINTYTFEDCGNLETLEVSAKNTTFHSSGNCIIKTSTKELVLGSAIAQIPANVTSIGKYAFADRTALVSIQIPDKVTKVDNYAFADCSNLEQVTMGSGLTTLGTNVFYNCSKLTQVQFGSKLQTIGTSAFKFCTGLTQLQFGSSLQTIDDYAFEGCTGLTTLVLPEGLKTLGYQCFMNCTGLTDVTICKSLTSTDNGNNFKGCTSLKKLTLCDGLTLLGSSMFYDCTALETVTLPGTIKTIPSSCFYNCTGLKTVSFGEGITTISSSAFGNCAALESVTLPSTLTSLSSAFSGCTSLKVLTLPGSIKTVPSSCFNGSTSLKTVTLGEGITTISSSAFEGCTALETVIFPSTLTTISTSAFDGCSNLIAVSLNDGLQSIGKYAFRKCTSLEQVTLPSTLTTLNTYAFAYNTGLKSVTFDNCAVAISDYAFTGCTALETVDFGNAVTSIGYESFRDCKKLEQVHLPDSVTTVGSYVFRDCTSLKNVTFGSGLTQLQSNAFYRINSLETVTFTGNAPSINSSAFYYCNSNVTVYYPADNSTWSGVANKNYGGTLTWVANDPAAAGSSSGSSRSAKLAVYPGRQNSQQKEDRTVRTATFEGLVPGEEYVMLAMVSMTTEDLLAADNILYIQQMTADEKGTLVVEYVQRVTTGESYIMVCGASHNNLNSAQIQLPTMIADGELHAVDPVVICDGQALTEGEDYVIAGDADYTAAGQYTCQIRGIYDYAGKVLCDYTVLDVSVTAAFGDKVYHNLRLQDLTKIGYAFTIQAPGAEQYGVLIWDNTVSGQVTVNTPGVQNKALTYDRGFYTAESDGIYAQRLDTVYYAMPYVKIADQYIYGKVDVYSPLTYAQTILAGNDDELRQLMIDLLNYGSYAQLYFAESSGIAVPESLIHDSLSSTYRGITWNDDLKVATPVPDKDTDQTLNVTWYGTNLNLLEAIQMNMAAIGSFTGMYFWTEEAYTNAQVLDGTTASGNASIRKDSGYTIGGITGIVAQDIFDVYYLCAYDSSGNLGAIRADSVAAYATRLLESEATTEATKNLAKALLVYGNSAVAYFAQND